jgi:hypothetical protein
VTIGTSDLQSGISDLNLQDGNNYLNQAANQYIIKAPTVQGIAGFVFDYEGETGITFSSDITDHYLESNDPVNDHIARRPLRINLRGFVSELAVVGPGGVLGALNLIQNRLTTVPAYLGKYTPQATQKLSKAITQAQSTVTQINQGLARINNIVGLFPGATPQQSKQVRAFTKLVSLYNSRQVFSVQTPYAVHHQMAIETLTFVQPEETRDWTDISVTLKQLHFVETVQIANPAQNAGRALQQRQASVNQGKTQGTQSSLLFDGYSSLFGKS